jgi:outer membrane protein assembly factor BamB
MRGTMRTAALIVAVFVSRASAAENWPAYRGPAFDGHSDAASIPLTWSETQHVKWKTAIPGKGWSSPVVWGNQVWMTTATPDGKERWAVCVEKGSGKMIHHVKLFDVPAPESIHDLNSHASPSPVLEAGRAYIHFGTYGTVCLDTAGAKVLWKRDDIHVKHAVGPGSSPILFDDLLIFHSDGIDQQFIIALDKKTGRTAWQTPRSGDLSAVVDQMRKSFCVPIVVEVGDHKELVSLGAQAIYGYDPATGKELWKIKTAMGYSNVAVPVAVGDTVIFSTGYDVPELWAIKLGGKGDVTNSNILWKYKRAVPTKPSPVVVDGLVYMVNDSGIATCLDVKTGEEVWKQRIGGQYTASLLYAAGRVYVFDQETGKTTVIAPGREFKLLAANKLDDGFMASPAVSGGAIFLRTKTHLYRIED